MADQPILFNSEFDVIEAYNSGFIGAREPSAEELSAFHAAIAESGGTQYGAVASARYGLKDSGKGKLSIPFREIFSLYPDCLPGGAQGRGVERAFAQTSRDRDNSEFTHGLCSPLCLNFRRIAPKQSAALRLAPERWAVKNRGAKGARCGSGAPFTPTGCHRQWKVGDYPPGYGKCHKISWLRKPRGLVPGSGRASLRHPPTGPRQATNRGRSRPAGV